MSDQNSAAYFETVALDSNKISTTVQSSCPANEIQRAAHPFRIVTLAPSMLPHDLILCFQAVLLPFCGVEQLKVDVSLDKTGRKEPLVDPRYMCLIIDSCVPDLLGFWNIVIQIYKCNSWRCYHCTLLKYYLLHCIFDGNLCNILFC